MRYSAWSAPGTPTPRSPQSWSSPLRPSTTTSPPCWQNWMPPPGTSPWPTPRGSTGATPQKNRRTQQEKRGIAPDFLRSRPPYGRLELIVSRGGRHEPMRRIAAVLAADEQEPDDPHTPLHDRRSRGDRP